MFNIKVAILHNTVAPYRHPLFEQLSKNVDLIVYQCSERESTRKWELWPRNYSYKFKVLSRIFIKTPIGDFNLNPTIVTEIVKNRPHVVIINGYTDPTTWITFAISKILKIPTIHWTEGIKQPTSFLGFITRPIRKLFITQSDCIVVPGKLSKNYVISLGAKREKVFLAPNAIDNVLFIRTSQKYYKFKNQLKAFFGFEDKIVIFSVGQLIERKGFEYLLQAYSRIEKEFSEVALLICGSGPLKNKLIELGRKFKIQKFKIIDSGISLKQLIALYSIAEVFVLPTLEDVWGFVINEAMVCGLPVISTFASQAALEMINDGENGYIVKEGNPEELYVALKKVIEDHNLREKMRINAIETVTNKFNVSKMADGFISAIKYSIKVIEK
ncbi:MAG: glycosyltransferase family 4 protein [Nitrososphaeria archaeon]